MNHKPDMDKLFHFKEFLSSTHPLEPRDLKELVNMSITDLGNPDYVNGKRSRVIFYPELAGLVYPVVGDVIILGLRGETMKKYDLRFVSWIIRMVLDEALI